MPWGWLAVVLLLFLVRVIRRALRPRTRLIDGVPIAVKGVDGHGATLTAYLPETPIQGRRIASRDVLFAMFQSLRMDAFCKTHAVQAGGLVVDGDRLILRIPGGKDVDETAVALASLARDYSDSRYVDERLANLAESGPESVRGRAAILLALELPGSAATKRACAALGWDEAHARGAARGGLSLPAPNAGGLALKGPS